MGDVTDLYSNIVNDMIKKTKAEKGKGGLGKTEGNNKEKFQVKEITSLL